MCISTCVRVEVQFTLCLKTFTYSGNKSHPFNWDDKYDISLRFSLSFLLVSWGVNDPSWDHGFKMVPFRWLNPPPPPPPGRGGGGGVQVNSGGGGAPDDFWGGF